MEQMYYWLILFVVLLVIEFATMGLTTIWFAGGSLMAFFVALFTENLMLQLIVFLIVSMALLILTRPIAMKYLQKSRIKTNYETYVGKRVKVIEAIDNLNSTGQVLFNGIEWTARASSDGIKYKVDDMLVIKDVVGVKLIVNKGEIE